MEYLQYLIKTDKSKNGHYGYSFKPYYKWNTFNTLVIYIKSIFSLLCFKPYYKWNTFNTIAI